MGFELLATSGTAEVLKRNGIHATVVRKQSEGEGPDGEPTIVQLIHDGQVDLIVNTPYGTGGRLDGYDIRTAAVARGVPVPDHRPGAGRGGAGHRRARAAARSACAPSRSTPST